MARKIDPNAPLADAPAPASNPLEDLYVLMPEVELELAGRKLTVREFTLWQSMQARGKAAALVDDLQRLVDDGAAADAGIEAYLDLLARHFPVVRTLMAESIDGADADFIDGLSSLDGERLLTTWWTVTGRFFWRAVVARLRDRTLLSLRREAAKAASAGRTSLPSSAAPDTAAPASSDASIPSVN